MRKPASEPKSAEQTAPLLESDGCTLRPVEARWLESLDALSDYLAAIDDELKKDGVSYVKYSYPLLMGVMSDAFGGDPDATLAVNDLRGLLSARVQWVRLYKDLLGEKLRKAHVIVEDNEIDVIHHPFPLMAMFMDSMLFLAELTDPRINLLTRTRRHYHMARTQLLWGDYVGSPVQEISQIAWRRYLLHNQQYLKDEVTLRRNMGNTSWAFFGSSRLDLHEDWLVFFEAGNPAQPRIAAPDDERRRMMHEFCFGYKLEMVGTFLGDSRRLGHLHILPHRVHSWRTDWGVRVDIPEFYRPECLRSHIDTDFNDLKVLLGMEVDPKVEKSSDVFLTPEELRLVGVLIRKALLKDGQTKEYANTALKLLWQVRNLSPERVLGRTKFEEVKDMPPVSKLMKVIDACIEGHTSNPRQRWLWAEFCRSMTCYDKYDALA